MKTRPGNRSRNLNGITANGGAVDKWVGGAYFQEIIMKSLTRDTLGMCVARALHNDGVADPGQDRSAGSM